MDATFWVAVSFVIFFGFLIYKKIPGMIASSLDDKISEITKKIDEAEKLKLENKQLLNKYQKLKQIKLVLMQSWKKFQKII